MKNLKKIISDNSFKIERKINKFFINRSDNKRPSSYPYISGDTFCSLADHFYGIDNKNLNIRSVKEKDIVFVESNLLDEYLEKIHKNIEKPYILIAHNGDKNIGLEVASKIDNRIIMMFAQNVLVEHPKITPIPIGLENLHYYNNGITKYFNKLTKKPKENRLNKILFGFSIKTNPAERSRAFQYLSNNKICDGIKDRINAKTHLFLLNNYKFVASPAGNGLDCHRSWEALYLGIVPITRSACGMNYFKNLGLPFYIINDWSEIKNLDENKLTDIYNSLTAEKKSYKKFLFFDYWRDLILKYKN